MSVEAVEPAGPPPMTMTSVWIMVRVLYLPLAA
jgi:hypothetical protein